MKTKITLLLCCFYLLACNVPSQQILKGNYDDAIIKLCKKLSRNPHKDDNIILLERAYLGAQQQDLNRIDYLKKENSDDNWVEINEIYRGIKVRQNRIRPLLPLHIVSLKRDCNIKLIDVTEQLIASGNKAADYFYNNAVSLLKNNNRQDARKAFYDLKEIKNYPNSYTDVAQLMAKAKFNGTNHILFRMKNASNTILPADFEKELLKISLQDLNTEWVQYNTTQQENMHYDYEIIANIKVIDVSPEQQNEREYREQKQIQDGWEYVLDSKGNVKKDSLGNDIKHPKMKTIFCDVKEIKQLKVATIKASLDYVNLQNNQLTANFPIKSDAVFEHYSALIHGNVNALTEATKAKLNSKPVPFPTNVELLQQCGGTIKPTIKQALSEHRGLVEN